MAYSYAWKGVLDPGNAVDFFQSGNPRDFKVHSRYFNRANGWLFSELSRLMYMRGENGDDSRSQTAARNLYLQRIGLKETWYYNGEHIQCAVVSADRQRGEGFSVLVFRGTQGGLASWLFNLRTVLSAWCSGGQVQEGFKSILMEAWQDIRPQLDCLTGPLFFTGHSLGGALAVLAASLKAPDAVYTFGSPRIGDIEFVESIQHLNIYRVVSPRDIVAVVPPIPGVLHVGEPHLLKNPDGVTSQRGWFDAPGFLADHSPSNYTVMM